MHSGRGGFDLNVVLESNSAPLPSQDDIVKLHTHGGGGEQLVGQGQRYLDHLSVSRCATEHSLLQRERNNRCTHSVL